jgi:UDP-GlcNAc:undecaprenyl-phosphate/decaprenyl-phosphate GlcNAc-1-phosphate transferase
MSMWLACCFTAAFVAVALLTPVSAKIAVRFGVVALPDPDVKGHVRATPLLGGGAILVGLVPVLLVCAFRDSYWVTVAGAVAAMAALGIYKDYVRREVSPLSQLTVQIVALALLHFAVKPVRMPEQGAAATGVSMFCCLWIINSWNFLDVMDGLAVGVGAIVAAFFAAGHARIGATDGAIVSASLAGSLAGFLTHNYPPATIFMGDLGSFPIGILFCSLLLSGITSGNSHTRVGFGLMLFVPLFDIAATSLTRIFAGRSPLKGHSPDHLCLRLSRRGWSDRAVISHAYVLALLTGLIGLAWIFHG